MGAVTDNLTWTDLKEYIKRRMRIEIDVEDTDLEQDFDAAKGLADEYLNNPFERLVPTVYVSGVEVGDAVAISTGEVRVLSSGLIAERYLATGSSGSLTAHGEGLAVFTAATSKNEDKREFAVGEDDSETADNLCELVNSTTLGGSYQAVGVKGVKATNEEGVITLECRYPNVDEITVTSSSEVRLLVRQVLTFEGIPDVVQMWIAQFMLRNYENPQALLQEKDGRGSRMWTSMKSEESGMTPNFSLIAHLRLLPGL